MCIPSHRSHGRTVVIAVVVAVLQAVVSLGAVAMPSVQTPTPSAVACSTSEPVCAGDGVTVEILATDWSADTTQWWAFVRTTLVPDVAVHPEVVSMPTRYVVFVQDGTVALTADVPVICTGSCIIDAPGVGGTPESNASDVVSVAPGTEVLLRPGDSATFEERGEVRHTYHNVGANDVRLLSTVFGPSADDAECKGRCLTTF